MRRNFIILFLIFFSLFQCYTDSFGQNLYVPVRMQSALIKKLLKYNSKTSGVSRLKILIIYNNDSKFDAKDMAAELGNSMEVLSVLPAEIPESLADFNAVYFMPGLQDKAEICKDNKLLSICCVPGSVENGEISLAFGLLNNKPKIYLSMTSLKDEDQNFSTDILNISKVYR